jgi:hypothetical protein
MAWISLNLVPRVHLRLISSNCVSSDPTPNIWWQTVDRGAPGRGKALRFILVNPGRHGSTMRSSWWTCDSYSERCHSIGFQFHRCLKNSATMFQAAVRQSAMINPIDGAAWPPIRTPSMITWSYGLPFSKIQAMKPEESGWSGVTIGQRSIPPASTQRSTGLRR